MNREDILRMAREAGVWIAMTGENKEIEEQRLERFAALVAAAERKAMMQLFTDPENQPTQYGTVTVEYMQREISAEREACAKVADNIAANHALHDSNIGAGAAEDCAELIRARGD